MTIGVLDRMALDDVGANPVRLADAIHAQLGEQTGPVPVEAIAHGLDIVEIRVAVLKSIEGALITNLNRDCGAILVNQASGRQRQRFTIAHELGHFLSPHHVPTAEDGFSCSRSDLKVARRTSNTPHQRQEAEANTFAIELLAPRRRLTRYRRGVPGLEAVLAIADTFDISREASARRYVDIHDEPLAVVFSQNGRVRSSARSRHCPALTVSRDHLLPDVPIPSDARGLSDIVEGDPRDWLIQPEGVSLSVQVLHQQVGWMLTLLHVDGRAGDDPDGLESLDERLAGRFPARR